jgi:hypothetical protein
MENITLPYTDSDTRNLVLQKMSEEPIDGYRFYSNVSVSHPGSTKNTTTLNDVLDKEVSFAKLDREERASAYRSIVVGENVSTGLEKEIRENPFTFLNLQEDVTFGETRASWVNLCKMWSPDIIFPEKKDQFHCIFGKEKKVFDLDYEVWINKIKPKGMGSLDDGYNEDEASRQYQAIKKEMQEIATEKIKVIHKAYEYARERFSEKEKNSFVGLSWQLNKKHTRSITKNTCFEFDDELDFEEILLEGTGYIGRNVHNYDTDNMFTYVGFDYWGRWNDNSENTQKIDLRSFFIWTELIQQSEISPDLLQDMVDSYSLDIHKTEQLRSMMMQGESSDFISDTLKLKSPEIMDIFIAKSYEGPIFSHYDRHRDTQLSYNMGVEMTSEGGMIFHFLNPGSLFGSESYNDTAIFTGVDVKLMCSLAYGPLISHDK